MKVSVIIPTFNHENYISSCVRSLLNQDLNYKKDFEIIVVNDGSIDNTSKVLRPFMSDIIYFENNENKGLPYSVNRGIREAKGRYIVRVDSDDFVSEKFISTLLFYMENYPISDAVSCDYFLIDDKDSIISRHSADEEPIACGIMFNRDHMLNLGLYNEDFLRLEDIEFRERFSERYTIGNLPLPLYRYRRHNSNITNNKLEVKHYREKLRIAKRKTR